MAALPKRKISRARSGKRRASKRYSPIRLSTCPKCGNPRMGHRACLNCGYYKENLVIAPKQKAKVTKVKKEEQ
ncbi:MAG: 50S ribosomal protein L32 [bacterium]|nr:50S ribosomal protein L32 [bacterium]